MNPVARAIRLKTTERLKMNQQKPECECSAALQHSFQHVEDAVFGRLADAIVASSDLTARLNEKWMSVYRCRACDAYWVAACASSGMMEIEHLYPLPAGIQNPEQWLREKGQPLTFRPRWK